MIARPPACCGCPLDPIAEGFMRPTLAEGEAYRVALIGEALGADEAVIGAPFVGKAGFRLTRLLEWAGLDRKRFDIFNTVWCRPPDNALDGESYEASAIAHCRAAHWEDLLARSAVIVPMGNVAMGALLGVKGILSRRGYLEGRDGRYVLPTVHPSFIQRGQSRWSAPFIWDLQKAVKVAREGVPAIFTAYRLDPSPLEALQWAEQYRRDLANDPSIQAAFDIETPWKSDDEEDLDTDADAPDASWQIDRIGFSYRSHHALSIPWGASYFAAIRTILESHGEKIVWNQGFDVPRIRRMGININGIIHDGMIAWHVLHTDLPKRLEFVATCTCPYQPAWKHLASAKPAFYNATDADVEYQSMQVIAAELRRTGLWDVYQSDVLDLEPILLHMHQAGMPVDPDIRIDRAVHLAALQSTTKAEMEAAVPLAARRIDHVFVRPPKDLTGLHSRPGTRTVRRCARCGLTEPRKDHFKRFVKKSNPCADGVCETVSIGVDEYYRLAPFTPSRDQLLRYHQFYYRPLPMIFDKKSRTKKVSFGERQIRELAGLYGDDPLYALILAYRSYDKIAGTYIGRPVT